MKPTALILSIVISIVQVVTASEPDHSKKLISYGDSVLDMEWYLPSDWKPQSVDIGINKNQPTWVNPDRTGIISVSKENRILSKEQIQKEEAELREADNKFKAYDIMRSGRKWHIQSTKLGKMHTLHLITYLDEKTVRFTIVSPDPSENNMLMKTITGTFIYLP